MPSASSPSRIPTLPSNGGLLKAHFEYRTAEKTDVRLTWERARLGASQKTMNKSQKP